MDRQFYLGKSTGKGQVVIVVVMAEVQARASSNLRRNGRSTGKGQAVIFVVMVEGVISYRDWNQAGLGLENRGSESSNRPGQTDRNWCRIADDPTRATVDQGFK